MTLEEVWETRVVSEFSASCRFECVDYKNYPDDVCAKLKAIK